MSSDDSPKGEKKRKIRLVIKAKEDVSEDVPPTHHHSAPEPIFLPSKGSGPGSLFMSMAVVKASQRAEEELPPQRPRSFSAPERMFFLEQAARLKIEAAADDLDDEAEGLDTDDDVSDISSLVMSMQVAPQLDTPRAETTSKSKLTRALRAVLTSGEGQSVERAQRAAEMLDVVDRVRKGQKIDITFEPTTTAAKALRKVGGSVSSGLREVHRELGAGVRQFFVPKRMLGRNEITASTAKLAASQVVSLMKQTHTQRASYLQLLYHVGKDTVHLWVARATPDRLQQAFPAIITWMTQTSAERRGEAIQALSRHLQRSSALRMSMGVFFELSHRSGLKAPFPRDYRRTTVREEVMDGLHGLPTITVTTERRAVLTEIEEALAIELSDAERATVDLVEDTKQYGAMPDLKGKTVDQALNHPFTGDSADGYKVIRVFTSQVMPCQVGYTSQEGGDMEPTMMAKRGDNLQKDHAAMFMFKVFSEIWGATPDNIWAAGRSPFARFYRVLCTGAVSGYLEFVPGDVVKNINDKGLWPTMPLEAMIPSMVGAYCSVFVLGIRDRHWDNIMVVQGPEHEEILMIDFGFMLTRWMGPIDTPRFSMQPELVKLLKTTVSTAQPDKSLFDLFCADLVEAFMTLRRRSALLIRLGRLAFAHIMAPDDVETFLRHTFYLDNDEQWAMANVTKKITKQFSSGIVVRRGMKLALVKGYYAVKNQFNPHERKKKRDARAKARADKKASRKERRGSRQ